jgi:hypothetical protein
MKTTTIMAAEVSELPTTTMSMRFQVTSAMRQPAPETKKAR